MDYKKIIKDELKNRFDNLNKFLTCIFIIILIVRFFTKNLIIDLIILLLPILIIYRMFSKNRYSIIKQNKIFNKIVNIFIPKRKYDKEHIYVRCKRCKTILRLPLPPKRGIKHTSCPHCHQKISFFTLRKDKIKIDIIKNK